MTGGNLTLLTAGDGIVMHPWTAALVTHNTPGDPAAHSVERHNAAINGGQWGLPVGGQASVGDAVDVVDAVDGADGAQDVAEVLGGAHLKRETADRDAVP
jgi:hypothetical protein